MASSQDQKAADVVSLFAAKDLKPKTLLLLPFNMPLVSGTEKMPSGAVKAVVTVTPNKEEAAHTMFWIKPKVLSKKAHTQAHGETALTIVPFWVAIAKASSQETIKNLSYATAIIQIVTPPAICRGVRVHKGKMTLKVMCLTNLEAIEKGTPLMTSEKPPTELPEDALMGV